MRLQVHSCAAAAMKEHDTHSEFVVCTQPALMPLCAHPPCSPAVKAGSRAVQCPDAFTHTHTHTHQRDATAGLHLLQQHCASHPCPAASTARARAHSATQQHVGRAHRHALAMPSTPPITQATRRLVPLAGACRRTNRDAQAGEVARDATAAPRQQPTRLVCTGAAARTPIQHTLRTSPQQRALAHTQSHRAARRRTRCACASLRPAHSRARPRPRTWRRARPNTHARAPAAHHSC